MKIVIRLYILTLFAAGIWIAAVCWLVEAFALPVAWAMLIFSAAVSAYLILSIHWMPCPPHGNAFVWFWVHFHTVFLPILWEKIGCKFRRYGDLLLLGLFFVSIVMLVVAQWVRPDPFYESFIGFAGLLMGFVTSVWSRALRPKAVGLIALCSFVIYVFPGSLANFCVESSRHAYALCGTVVGLQDWSSFYLGIGLALMSGTLPQLWPRKKHHRRV